MLITRGRTPDSPDTRSRSRSRPRPPDLFLLAAGLLLIGPLTAIAAPDAVLTLEEAEALAVAVDPVQAMLDARAAALDANAVVAGSLPDPSVRIGMNNYPLDGAGFTADGMTNAGLVYRQAFPGGRTREYRSDVFEREGEAMRHELDGRVRDVRLAVRELWLALWFAERTLVRLSDARPHFENLATITRSQYTVGRRNQQELLSAEIDLARLEDRVVGIDTTLATQRARLAEWIGDAAYRPLPAEPVELPPVPALAELEARLDAHPLVESADAKLAARTAAVRRADERSKPGWALDVGYGYRDGVQPSGESRSDLVTVGVTLDLPWFNRQSVDAELTAALAERRAAEASREQVRRRLAADLAAEYARWQELGRRVALYRDRILAPSAASADAALNAYRVDATDFAGVMRAHIDEVDAEIEVLQLELEQALSRARLASLGGL